MTAAVSVIGTLGVTYFGHWLGLSKDKQLRQEELDRHARFLAIRVVCKLDPFVSECCLVVHDQGAPDQQGEMYPLVGEPTLSFPEDVDWKSVKPDLMYRILSFPNDIEIGQQYISFVAEEIAFPPDYEEFFRERTIEYGRLGLNALVLANEIRETYGIPQRVYGDRHPKDALEAALAKAKKASEQSNALQAESIKEITKGSAGKSSEAGQKQ
ncbi:MAG: hypothetical protein MI824_19150 [Hyphomicrobiales bacterium]|nr:hypothetical protein [Hyphomicrobiales bacterium]